jgi:hypothetical protein
MSLLVATQITAIATAVLAVGAIVTAVFAFLAFRAQAAEVGILSRQLEDQQALTRHEAKVLEVQSRQLELQASQFEEQSKVNVAQAEVFDLQAQDLQASLDERKREALERRQVQAALVFVSQVGRPNIVRAGERPPPMPRAVVAHVQNTSDQPVYEVEVAWHLGSEPYGEPNPESLGTAPPHTHLEAEREFPVDTDPRMIGVALRFRDAAGIRWQRRPDGELTELTG